MLYENTTGASRRIAFREGLSSGKLLRLPGAFNPLTAKLIEELGFEGVYVSGAALSADLGLPDIGLTTVDEVANRAHQIARMTNLPALVDADTGFGESMNVARTIQTFEEKGIAACHIEDQINPKRCGHLDGKDVVAQDEMIRRITAAVSGRRDKNFVICARTDARAVEGLDRAIDRAKAYIDAGADMIFAEALENEGEFEKVRSALQVPLLANMTEFGKGPLLDAKTLENIGINVVIYPVSTLRLAMGAVEEGLRTIFSEGTQQSIVDKMQTRARLYELLDYESYKIFDEAIFNFSLREPDN